MTCLTNMNNDYNISYLTISAQFLFNYYACMPDGVYLNG